jgi:hypothetical protein|tara:strand:- start:240 stop:434 length:195 start_codon:yes stop_codon:yes gene_type:complete
MKNVSHFPFFPFAFIIVFVEFGWDIFVYGGWFTWLYMLLALERSTCSLDEFALAMFLAASSKKK